MNNEYYIKITYRIDNLIYIGVFKKWLHKIKSRFLYKNEHKFFNEIMQVL